MTNPIDEMKLIIPKGCDNAPRKQIVIDFTVAALLGNADAIRDNSDESVVWHRLKEGERIEGRDTLASAVQNNAATGIACIEIYQVITHGKFASINGLISFAAGKQMDFCDVLVFSNAAKSGKVKEIRSYQLETHQG